MTESLMQFLRRAWRKTPIGRRQYERRIHAAAIARFEQLEREEAARPKTPSPRIAIEAGTNSPEAQYFKRLLEYMYTRWEGTLDHECGVHRLCIFSQFDEQGRRHTSFARVIVDGERSEDRVRSYVLGPYLAATDHRTGRRTDDPWKVLHGDLTPLLPEVTDG